LPLSSNTFISEAESSGPFFLVRCRKTLGDPAQ
jgi:hypothetical protein